MSKQTDAMKDDTKELTLFDNYDFIVRTVLGTLTVESDCYCHINYK